MFIYICEHIFTIHVYMYTWTFQRVPLMVPGQGVNFSIFLGLSVTSWKVHRYILCLFFVHGLDVTSDTFVVGEGQNHSDGGQSGTGYGHRDPV